MKLFNLNNSNNDCNWLILGCFIREQYTADPSFTPLESKCGLKLQRKRGEIIGFFAIKQIKKPRLYSVML